MKFKYFFGFLFLSANMLVFSLQTFALSEVIFYKDESAICTPCSQGRPKVPYPTSSLDSTAYFAKSLDSRSKKLYCNLAKKAVSDIQSAFEVELNSSENMLFTLSSKDITKFFSLTLPNVSRYDERTIETSDFTYQFFSDNVCESIGFCYAKIDLNKTRKPNVLHHDIIYVNFLYDGKTLKLQDDAAGLYTSIMCEE